MYCPACGNLVAQRTKYCKNCGNQLVLASASDVTRLEKRFDDYVDGLFWTVVFGLGLILGGAAIIREGLKLGDGWLIGYLVLSSLAFLSVFAVSLWQIVEMGIRKARASGSLYDEQYDTNRLASGREQMSLTEGPSVTEDTTRSFEPVPVEKAPR